MSITRPNLRRIYRVAVFSLIVFFLEAAALGQDAKFEIDEVDQSESAWARKGSHMKSGLVSCEGGLAGSYPCSNVQLVSFLPLEDIGAVGGIGLNDAWGWVDPDTGDRYALVGREDALSFVKLTDPENPVFVGELPRPTSAQVNVWRDVKIDGYYAFVVADGGGSRQGMHGMQVFDLRRLRNFSGAPITFDADAHYREFNVAHNIVVNEETDRAYIVGSRVDSKSCGGGLHIVDISDPLNPVFEGCFADTATGRQGTGYTHDAQCVLYMGPDTDYAGREICIGANETAISIADVTDAENPIAVSRADYPSSTYIHQGWLTEDHRFYVQNDEGDERVGVSPWTRTFIWDVEDLDDPVLLTAFVSDVSSIDHNLYIRADFVYQANYTSGLRILDISNPRQPFIAGYFDTLPSRGDISFNGAWTAYPYPDSDLIIVTGRDEGLFVLRPSSIIGTRIASVVATAGDASITIQWEMSAQNNVASYRLEQRLADDSYELLIEIPASLNTPENQSYETVVSVPKGVHHIRVSAIGIDGGVVTSEDVVAAVFPGTHLLQDPYPNPSSNQVFSSLAVSEFQSVRASIVDLTGREVALLFEGRLSQEQQLDLVFDSASMAGGVYFLRVVGDHFNATRSIVISR